MRIQGSPVSSISHGISANVTGVGASQMASEATVPVTLLVELLGTSIPPIKDFWNVKVK